MNRSKELQFLSQLDKIRYLLGAFSTRDVQVANTLATWLAQNNVTVREFQEYMKVWYEINRLTAKGYFNATHDRESGKYVRALERAIQDPVVRRYARNMRMAMTVFSAPGRRP